MKDARVDEIRQLLPQAMLPDWVRLGRPDGPAFARPAHPQQHDALLDRLLAQVRASVALREERAAECSANHAIRRICPSRRARTTSWPPSARIRSSSSPAKPVRARRRRFPRCASKPGLGIEAKIGCTQPRRVAALSISRRIAEELNVNWGREVGCKIRFDDRSSAQTYIKLMTDGILLAETQGDPDCSRNTTAIIIDEAHERSLNIDFLLGHLKALLAKRNDLKLIITSATIDTQAFSRALQRRADHRGLRAAVSGGSDLCAVRRGVRGARRHHLRGCRRARGGDASCANQATATC